MVNDGTEVAARLLYCINHPLEAPLEILFVSVLRGFVDLPNLLKFMIGVEAISNPHVPHTSLGVIVVIRTRSMCWEGKAACMGEMKHVWNFRPKSDWKI